MQLDDRDSAYLYDMVAFSRDVLRYIDGKSVEDLATNDLLKSAVERKIELIGEAARNVSTEIRRSISDIPWRNIVATRNILVHDYDEVNIATLWRIATVHLPELIVVIEPLLPPPEKIEQKDPDRLTN